MANRTVLKGRPRGDGLEEFGLPGITEWVIAKPGSIQLEQETVAGGQAVRSRWWHVDEGGKETVLHDRMEVGSLPGSEQDGPGP